ncbi:MAG: redoxin domain-containing protein [Gammaproteobacteria bacterium]|nr:redoxin domain-containing protein [Gammaproteobacteria bacterium]
MSTNFTLILLFTSMIFLSGCEEDLMPSNDPIHHGISSKEGEVIDDLSFAFTNDYSDTLSNRLTAHDGVILYFTMWCPVCDSHMSQLRSRIQTQYPDVDIIFVDYISKSVAYAKDAQQALGYTDFPVAADVNDTLENYFNGTMATTVIIDKNFVVRFHQVFKTSDEIIGVLNTL